MDVSEMDGGMGGGGEVEWERWDGAAELKLELQSMGGAECMGLGGNRGLIDVCGRQPKQLACHVPCWSQLRACGSGSIPGSAADRVPGRLWAIRRRCCCCCCLPPCTRLRDTRPLPWQCATRSTITTAPAPHDGCWLRELPGGCTDADKHP